MEDVSVKTKNMFKENGKRKKKLEKKPHSRKSVLSTMASRILKSYYSSAVSKYL